MAYFNKITIYMGDSAPALAPLLLEIFHPVFEIPNRRPFANPGILRGLDCSCPGTYVVAP
jgi:hypothetical protein